jgi:hypothetical protein
MQDLHREVLAREAEWKRAKEQYVRAARKLERFRLGNRTVRTVHRHIATPVSGTFSSEERRCMCPYCQKRAEREELAVEVGQLSREAEECRLRLEAAKSRYDTAFAEARGIFFSALSLEDAAGMGERSERDALSQGSTEPELSITAGFRWPGSPSMSIPTIVSTEIATTDDLASLRFLTAFMGNDLTSSAITITCNPGSSNSGRVS